MDFKKLTPITGRDYSKEWEIACNNFKGRKPLIPILQRIPGIKTAITIILGIQIYEEGNNNSKYLKEKKDKLEIGKYAIWSLSSAKTGFGIEQLRDNNLETYWQSDGYQPHLINIIFYKRMIVEEINIYVDFRLDESYTPNKISIRSGTTFQDLKEIKIIDLEEPKGWINILISNPKRNDGIICTSFIQIAILSNHQNGRDVHIRQVNIYGSRSSIIPFQKIEFSTEEFQMYSQLR